MPLDIVAIVLVAALAHASWNALAKGDDDRLVIVGGFNAVRSLICLPVVLALPLPAPASWSYLVVSAFLHLGYYAFLVTAYRYGDLSKVYPLARGLSPLVVAAGAFVLAGERLGPMALAGVAVACTGIASLSLGSAGVNDGNHRRGVFFAVVTALFIASYTVTDALGVRLSGHAVSYIAWLSLLDGPPLLIVAVMKNRTGLVRHLSERAWKSVAGGSLQLLAYGLVVWALALAPMAAVSALRETSVLFAAVMGVKLMGEPLGTRRIASAALVAAGIVMIELG